MEHNSALRKKNFFAIFNKGVKGGASGYKMIKFWRLRAQCNDSPQ